MVGSSNRDAVEAALAEPFDSGDAEAVQRRNQIIDFAEQQKLAGWLKVKRQLLATPDGRSWCWQLLQDGHVFNGRMPMTAAPYEQGYFNGEQQRGLGLMRILAQADPANFAAMLTENDSLPKVEADNAA